MTAAVVIVSATCAQAESVDEITAAMKADCAAEWAGDFAMQEFCYNRQVKAYNNLVPISQNEKDDNLRGALAKCLDDWTTANGQDWAMVEFCYGRQRDAYRRMKGN